MREAMWAVVQQGISTLDFDYVALRHEHFDRLLANASRPGYRDLAARTAASVASRRVKDWRRW